MEGSSDRQVWLVRFLLCKLETHECQYKADGCGSGRPRRVDRAGRMGDRKYWGGHKELGVRYLDLVAASRVFFRFIRTLIYTGV